MFDESPKVGDKIKVIGKIKSIDDQSGQVEASYDSVTIITKRHMSKNSKNDHYVEANPPDQTGQDQGGMNPNSQSLDQALSQAFPQTQ